MLQHGLTEPGLKKSLGQHFLISPAICQRIAGLMRLAPEDQVLEIGPGAGALTQFLVPHRTLWLIEKDRHWASQHSGATRVLTMDALDFDWQTLAGRWKLAGNLPYNIASPLIWNIVSSCSSYDLAVFMVQKEVGVRICANPGSRLYGALSVWVQCHAQVRLEFTVKPGSFKPPPKVDSAVVSFQPLASLPGQPEALNQILQICFQARRKQLGGIFRKFPALEAALAALGIDPRLRPEDLARQDFLALAAVIAGD